MKSRLLGGVAAVVLALIGAVLVFSYAANADARAMQNLEPTNVLVVRKAVPTGTPAEELSESVALEARPAGTVPGGALTDLTKSVGLVTVADLVPGEALLASRLADPATLQTPGSVPIPKGMQEVTIALEPQRVVGGRIAAGSTVGVFVTFGANKLDYQKTPTTTTGRVFHKMLVTSFQRADATIDPAEGNKALPAGSMLVTLAVDDPSAAKIIFSAENGSIWLTNEPKDATEQNPPKPIRIHEVYP